MPGLEIHSEWAKTLAEQLVASGDAPPVGLSDDERLALAWALKDLAYQAWSANPRMLIRSSDLLSAIRSAVRVGACDWSANDVAIEAISQWIRGIVAIVQGRMTGSIQEIDQAAVLFQSVGLRLFAAQTQVPKMIVLSMLGRHEDATELGVDVQKTLVAFGDLHGASKVSLNLGQLLVQRNDFLRAKEHFREASELFIRVGDDKHAVMSAIGMADAYAFMGNFDAAIDTLSMCKEQSEKHGFSVLSALVEESVALIELARGHYREALSGLESARCHYGALNMPQLLATAEKQLADAYLDLRLLPEALSLFDRAILRFKELEMPTEEAWALVQHGRALAALARPADEISQSWLRAAELFVSHGVSAGSATISLARAEYALSLGDAESAVSLAYDAATSFRLVSMAAGEARAEVVRAYALLQAGNHLDATTQFSATLDRSRTLHLLSSQIECLVGQGLVSQARSEVHAAQEAFESAVELSEVQRNTLPGDDFRNAFLTNHLRPYEELLRIALAQYQQQPSSRLANSVLTYQERYRARVLGERLGEISSNDRIVETDATAEEMRTRLKWLYRRSLKLLDDGENSEPLLVESRDIEIELLERVRRHRLTAETSGTLLEGVDIDTRSLRAALAVDERLMEYGVLDDEVFACVVTHDGVAIRRNVAKWTDVVAAIRTARFQIETLRNSAGKLNKHLDLLTRRSQTALRRVHDLIWAPLADLLMGCHRVLVVPHEQLGSVPFSALHDGEQYLSQRYEISVAPSARVALRGLGRQPLPPRRAVILGESSRLVHAVEEAQFVASLFDEATVLTGQDANGDALRAASVQADILHLACHGQFRSDNPMFSALHLVDGPFTVQDAEALRLPQGIVVLSACESGVATASKGDEVIGLVRAFLIAGAARVVASLWPVDDAVTTEFMAVFYSSLRAGASPAEALRRAQLEVMKTHPHPFHWAAFTVYGGW